MKTLQLKVTETKNKAGKFTYEVIENGKVIASRKSNRVYVACYVDEYNEFVSPEGHYIPNPNLKANGGPNESGFLEIFIEDKPGHFTEKKVYSLPYFFGRLDLVGKGDSGKRTSFYALAKI